MFLFATAVAEQFGKSGKFKTRWWNRPAPGGGVAVLRGCGRGLADIVNASRKIKDAEVETCKKNGVTTITEVTIGCDGIVLANSKQHAVYNLR